MKRKSNALVMLILLSLIFSLCGCESKSDSMKEDLQSLNASDSSGDAGENTVNELKKQLHIPEEVQIDAVSDDGMIGYQVNGKVDVPIETNPSVYQQKKIPFTRETIIKKAESLFDEGKFTYVKPLGCYTLKELNDEAAEVQDRIDKQTDETKQDFDWKRRGDIAWYQEMFKENEVKEFKEGDFTEGGRMDCYEKIMILEGELGGEPYDLLAYTSNGHSYLKLCKRSHGYQLTYEDTYFGYTMRTPDWNDETGWESDENAGSVKSVTVSVDAAGEAVYRSLINEEEPTQAVKSQYGENLCSYSEEEAAKLALQYAALLGDNDMAVAKTNWCFGQVSEASESLDDITVPKPTGYAFYLQRQYGKLPGNESDFWWRLATDKDKEAASQVDPSGIVAEQEDYRVEVTDKGVVAIDTIEPWYEVTKTLSDSTSLMDFSDIEELVKGYFEESLKNSEDAAGTEKNIIRISEVALRYATVLYDGEYTLIPCWFFNQSNGNYGGQSTVMVINAIDGSKVFAL